MWHVQLQFAERMRTLAAYLSSGTVVLSKRSYPSAHAIAQKNRKLRCSVHAAKCIGTQHLIGVPYECRVAAMGGAIFCRHCLGPFFCFTARSTLRG